MSRFLPRELLVEGDGDDLAAGGTEAALGEVLDERDRLGAVLQETRVQQVTADDADDLVAEFLAVQVQLLGWVLEESRNRLVDRAQSHRHLVACAERRVRVR